MEKAIEATEESLGQEEAVKNIKAKLADLQKKPMINTVAKDKAKLSQDAKQFEESTGKCLNAAKKALQYLLTTRTNQVANTNSELPSAESAPVSSTMAMLPNCSSLIRVRRRIFFFRSA